MNTSRLRWAKAVSSMAILVSAGVLLGATPHGAAPKRSATALKPSDTKPVTTLTPHASQAEMPPDAAWQILREGNRRFVIDQPSEKATSKRRGELVAGQHPFAVVLTCADSRVSPEILFDQGLGDLFVVRVAGNVTDPAVLGSIEYACEHLHAPLVAVLGHEKCGAVAAAVGGGKPEGNILQLVSLVRPGEGLPEDQEAAVWMGVRTNVRYHVDELTRRSPLLREMASAGHVKIVSGVYDLATGNVEWISQEAN